MSNPKDVAALTKIVRKVFAKYSLTDLRGLPDTCELIRPSHAPFIGVNFWGGLRFRIKLNALGVCDLRVQHDRGKKFNIELWSTSGPLPGIQIRVKEVPYEQLDVRVMQVLNDASVLVKWPDQCEYKMWETSPFVEPF
jgi:hypothetical protein